MGVSIDEVHLWALTRTAAVVGGDNRPPDSGILKKAVEISGIINAREIFSKIASKATEKEAEIEIQEQKVKVKSTI